MTSQVDVSYCVTHVREPLTGSVVILDVLRASSSIVAALQAGARCILPFQNVEDALQAHSRFPSGESLLAGERHGLPLPGFDLGNSPRGFARERVCGKVICFSTTNGTAAIAAAAGAKEVLIGCINNLHAIVEQLRDAESICFLCAGTDGHISLEDVITAGWMVDGLLRPSSAHPAHFHLTDAAQIAHATARNTADASPIDHAALFQRFCESLGGRNLLQLGLEQDIEDAARIDTTSLVPYLGPGGEILAR